jgi:hypothetical protein
MGYSARLRAFMTAVQPCSLRTIAMYVPGKLSSNDLSFSVKIQARSVLEIFVLAMITSHLGTSFAKTDNATYVAGIEFLRMQYFRSLHAGAKIAPLFGKSRASSTRKIVHYGGVDPTFDLFTDSYGLWPI